MTWKSRNIVFTIFRVIPKTLAICIVKMYRYLISPLTPASCRFIPTCSEYSITAFKKFGFFKGLKLTIKRIIRCRPGGGYGYDPVPESYPTPNKIKNRRGDLK